MIITYGLSLDVFVIFLAVSATSQVSVTGQRQGKLVPEQIFIHEANDIPSRVSRMETLLENVNSKLETLLTGQVDVLTIIIDGFRMMNETLTKMKECMNCQQLTCPHGYQSYINPNAKSFCYRFESNQCKSWSDARQTCQNEGGDLMIPDGNTYQAFRNLAKPNEGKCSHFWIGGYSSTPGSNYVTVKGNPIASNFPYWSSGQPDGLGGESCLEMRSYFTNYLMNDYICSAAQGFICQIFP
ncbi:hypothetical protein CHS0354_039057 [Potamilus streckersoni]|uniref:C-type lectin domain-containing protein n=1 Tax=Potamilus streckersoni TaxID=2493646 RepID=A0AAE0RRQ8_9BIVA|nr:hypothetical protein CHS0354_039057 [Potamilus streckersoni]